MKNLLTTITLSALVGTSTSNLKPLFANNVWTCQEKWTIKVTFY
ncbi:hypothetical protein [Spiroplasma endosymbiont of Lariophagus distinguendus]|nr:hypothetical protein [Spiroplasma endosymbiont of Lariophagus distinguendus]